MKVVSVETKYNAGLHIKSKERNQALSLTHSLNSSIDNGSALPTPKPLHVPLTHHAS